VFQALFADAEQRRENLQKKRESLGINHVSPAKQQGNTKKKESED